MRDLPRHTSETSLPQSDLLAQVAAAMKAGGLSAESLLATVPQPTQKLPGTNRAQIVQRLSFENVRLEPLVRFGFELTANNPALRVSALQLRAGADRQTWNADVSVAYGVLVQEQVAHPASGLP